AASRCVVGEVWAGVAVVGQQAGVLGAGLPQRACDVGLVGTLVGPLTSEGLGKRLVEEPDAPTIPAHFLHQVVGGASSNVGDITPDIGATRERRGQARP